MRFAAIRRPLRSAWQFFVSQSFSSLTRRIVFLNLTGLVALVTGVLYLSQFRAGLIDARVQSLLVQSEIIAGAIAASATVESDAVTIDPERLLELQAGESYGPADEGQSGIEFPINPERVAPVLRRLVSPTKTRARIYDRDGVLILDSRNLYGRGDVLRFDLPPPDTEQPGLMERAFIAMRRWFGRGDLPLYKELGPENGKGYPEVEQALDGLHASMVRVNDRGEVIVSVAVPVQRFRAVRGALMLSTQGADIDDMVEAERLAIVKVFLVAASVMVVLSMLLAGTIAGPVRRLADGAERVRRRIRSRVEIPDFTRRRDEIGELSGALREMTNALYTRIEAIESFAADVAHELRNPLTSLRSAVETLPLAKTDDSRRRLLEVIEHDVKRLDRLISDISDASRLDAELQRQEAGDVDLVKLLEALVTAANEVRAGRRQRDAHLRRRQPGGFQGARPRLAARPGGQQSDRQCALVLAARRQSAHHLPAARERGGDRGRRRRPRHPPRSLGKDLRALLHRPPDAGLRAELRSRPVDLQTDRRSPWRQHQGREPHQRRRRQPRAARARRALRGAAAGDVMVSRRGNRPRLRRTDRSEGGADPRARRFRQIASGLGSAASGRARRAALRAAGGGRPRACRGARRAAAGAPGRALAGMLEIRGLGIRRLLYEPVAVVGLVVDLAAAEAARHPGPEAGKTSIGGITLPRLAVAPGMPALAMVLAYLTTSPTAN